MRSIVHLASEMAPFVKVGGLGDVVAAALPAAPSRGLSFSLRNSTGAPSASRQRWPVAGLQSEPPETSWPFTQSRTSPSIARMK